VIILEVRLEVTRAHALSSTNNWLPLGKAVVRIGLRAMRPVESGEKFAPTENVENER
jgi:hypothetical protein